MFTKFLFDDQGRYLHSIYFIFHSPYLFNINAEVIFRESNDLEGINIHGHNINNLCYADGTALMANKLDNLQKVVTKVNEVSSNGG